MDFAYLAGINDDFYIHHDIIQKQINKYLIAYLPSFIDKKNFLNILKITLFYLKNKFFIGNELYRQLFLNNGQNIISFIKLFLPYIDDTENKQHEAKSVNDIIFNSVDNKDKTINSQKFCNYIYDHNKTIIENKDKKIIEVSVDNVNITDEDYLDNLSYFILKTIYRCSYKLYVNWITIFPIVDWRNSNLYQNSFIYDNSTGKFIATIYDEDDNQLFQLELNWFRLNDIDRSTKTINDTKYNESLNEMFFYRGINVEDIYNTLVNDYYYSVKPIKWLLFEYEHNDLIVIQVLNNLLGLSNIFNNISWDELSELEQGNFSKKIDLFHKYFISNSNDFNTCSYIYMFTSFIFYSKNINFLKKNKIINNLDLSNFKKIFDINNDDIIFFDQNTNRRIGIEFKAYNFSNDEISLLYNLVNKIPSEYIYNFLSQQVKILRNTVFNIKLFNNNILKNDVFENINGTIVSPKNYYNFGKSLSFNKNNQMSLLWEGLDHIERDLICARLNNNNNNWFNIKNILQKVKKASNLTRLNNDIFNAIRPQVVDLSFENLHRKGCLSEFKYIPDLSDLSKRDKLEENLKKYVFNDQNNYEEAYYYLTNRKYKKLDKIYPFLKKDKKYTYLELLANIKISGMDKWMAAYAFDWIGQIDFLLKYLNHSVLLVTGATGQGKSTQTPKLILYTLKAFNYKNNAKVLITQPRISPTVGVSTYISYQLGVPIEEYNEVARKQVKKLNGYVQYKYSNNQHININNTYFIRYVTDGSLLTDLKNSITLKKRRTTNQINPYDPEIDITKDNLYDNIIVDEAHEHNANMDIILSIMRNTLIYNNDIKLTIASATMEDDEPRFRKYYKLLDDNSIYPFNLVNNPYLRFYIDKRWHISPPGGTTRFKITEYYDNTLNDTYEDNKIKGIEKVKDICSNYPAGDILFFSIHTNEVIDICNRINKITTNDTVCLPFYAKLKKKYKTIIENIDSEKFNLNIHKKNIVDVFNGEMDEDYALKVKKNTYNRVIIVATNVAEASITINSLRYVIELGFEWLVKFNYDTLSNDLSAVKITESSRLQRKGRIGRVAPGTIFYMYPKGSRKYIKNEFNISISDFSSHLTTFLRIDDNKLIEANDLQELLDGNQIKIKKNEPNKIKEILNLQMKNYINYFQDKFGYIGDTNSSLTNFFKWLSPNYKSGFDINHILDISGHFWIIHPLENYYNRDIFTSNFLDKKTGKISTLPYSAIQNLSKTAELNLDVIRIGNSLKGNLFKTPIYTEIDYFKNLFKLYEMSDVKLYTISILFGNDIYDKVLFINSLLSNFEDIKKIITTETKLLKSKLYNKFFKNKNNTTDLQFFLNLYNMIKKNFKLNKIYDYINKKVFEIDKLKKMSNQNLLKSKFYNYIVELKLKGQNNLDYLKKKISDLSINKELIKDIIIDNIDLDQISELTLIRKDILLNSLIDYTTKLIKFNEYLNPIKQRDIIELENRKNILNKLLSIKKPNNEIEQIKLCFLYSNLDKLSLYKNNKLISIFNSKKYAIENYYNNSLTFVENISPILFYLKKNDLSNSYHILSNLNKDNLIKNFPHLYKYLDGIPNIKLNPQYFINHLKLYKKNIKNVYEINNVDIEFNNPLNVYYELLIRYINQSGGSNNYIRKYKKYKSKYLRLKNKLKL